MDLVRRVLPVLMLLISLFLVLVSVSVMLMLTLLFSTELMLHMPMVFLLDPALVLTPSLRDLMLPLKDMLLMLMDMVLVTTASVMLMLISLFSMVVMPDTPMLMALALPTLPMLDSALTMSEFRFLAKNMHPCP